MLREWHSLTNLNMKKMVFFKLKWHQVTYKSTSQTSPLGQHNGLLVRTFNVES